MLLRCLWELSIGTVNSAYRIGPLRVMLAQVWVRGRMAALVTCAGTVNEDEGKGLGGTGDFHFDLSLGLA